MCFFTTSNVLHCPRAPAEEPVPSACRRVCRVRALRVASAEAQQAFGNTMRLLQRVGPENLWDGSEMVLKFSERMPILVLRQTGLHSDLEMLFELFQEMNRVPAEMNSKGPTSSLSTKFLDASHPDWASLVAHFSPTSFHKSGDRSALQSGELFSRRFPLKSPFTRFRWAGRFAVFLSRCGSQETTAEQCC